MLKSNNKILLVTLGDPAGIGTEVTVKALLKIKLPKDITPVIIGNRDIWMRATAGQLNDLTFIHLTHKESITHRPGKPTPDSGKDSLLYLQKAVELIKQGRAKALVTGPVSKESICHFIPSFKGHTSFLAEAFAAKDVEMLFSAGTTKLVLVTRHVPLNAVPALITRDKLLRVIKASHVFLKERFAIVRPRIAVLGLNPHAGEGGHIGHEETKIIIPALRQLKAAGINVAGPFPADTFLEPRNCRGFDLIVSMYHDQALPVLKALYFDRLVNVTMGLPFIRTSPAHGTAFGIAGQGIADPGSMYAAITLASHL